MAAFVPSAIRSSVAIYRIGQIDLDKRKITFPALNAEVVLGLNKFYEFQDWKLACGGTQLYSMVGDSRETSIPIPR
jgi:hypothetical protein